MKKITENTENGINYEVKENIVCPDCNKRFSARLPFGLYEGTTNEMWLRIVHDDYGFEVKCPKCKTRFVLPHHCIYANSKYDFVIEFLPSDSNEEPLTDSIKEETKKYLICDQYEAFKVMLMIHALGLEDSLMTYYLQTELDDYNLKNDDECLFASIGCSTKGNLRVVLFDNAGERTSFPFNKEKYQQIAEQYKDAPCVNEGPVDVKERYKICFEYYEQQKNAVN